MENDCFLNEPDISLMDLHSEIRELSCYVGCEQYFIMRQEMNKFLLYLNRSEFNNSWQDQVHNLYISLYHLENIEKTLYSSDISEGIIHQSKIMDKLLVIKLVILDTIDDIKSDCYQ